MPLSDDILAGVHEIAEFIGKSERATYHLAANGSLPVFRIGKKIHARKSELERRLRAAA
jgi:hypothetical protein